MKLSLLVYLAMGLNKGTQNLGRGKEVAVSVLWARSEKKIIPNLAILNDETGEESGDPNRL